MPWWCKSKFTPSWHKQQLTVNWIKLMNAIDEFQSNSELSKITIARWNATLLNTGIFCRVPQNCCSNEHVIRQWQVKMKLKICFRNARHMRRSIYTEDADVGGDNDNYFMVSPQIGCISSTWLFCAIIFFYHHIFHVVDVQTQSSAWWTNYVNGIWLYSNAVRCA